MLSMRSSGFDAMTRLTGRADTSIQGCKRSSPSGARDVGRESPTKLFRAAVAAVLALAAAPLAFGHAGERGFILLLPTGLFQAAGTMAVAASFLVVIWVHGATLRRVVEPARWRLFPVPRRVPGSNAAASAALVALVVAGLAGSRDPLANPLPLSVWTLLWVGLTFVHAVFGNVWPHVNPWTAFARLTRRVLGRRTDDDSALLPWPDALGGWPAVALLLVFAWFELVFPAPRDPAILAYAVAGYSLPHGGRDGAVRGRDVGPPRRYLLAVLSHSELDRAAAHRAGRGR